MVRKTVELCDECREAVAIGKCVVCGKHLCRNHAFYVEVDMFSIENIKITIRKGVPKRIDDKEENLKGRVLCSECYKKLYESFRKIDTKVKEKFKEELARDMLKRILKITAIENLD